MMIRLPRAFRWLEGAWSCWQTAIALAAVGLGTAYWALHTSQLPGISIGLLAFAAGIMSLRPEMKLLEKMSWVIILSCFLLAEVSSIRKDRDSSQKQTATDRTNQDNDFEKVLSAQQMSFDATTKRLTEAYDINQKQFNATMERSNKAINGIQNNLEAATGGHSFPNYLVMNILQSNGTYRLLLLVQGQYPMKNMSAGIQTIESNVQGIEFPKDVKCKPCLEDYLNRRLQSAHGIPLQDSDALPNIVHPLTESVPLGKYQIDTYSTTGTFTETLTLELDENGQLKQKQEVLKQGNPPMIMVGIKLVPAHMVNGKLVQIRHMARSSVPKNGPEP
jgi:hypothetical protein